MSTTDVVLVVVSSVFALLAGALAVALVSVSRSLRDIRALLRDMRDDAHDVADAARETERNVARVRRLVTAAEKVDDTSVAAQRAAFKALGNPVVKTLAFGTGVSEAARRLKAGERDPEQERPARHGKRGRGRGRGRG